MGKPKADSPSAAPEGTPSLAPHLVRGRRGEQEACRFLQRHGLRLLSRNYRCRQGEIDLVMRDKDTLVFVEVRCRSHRTYGGAEASVDARKRRRLLRTASNYLATEDCSPQTPCRFDVIGVYPEAATPNSFHLEWIPNAFGL